MTPPEVVLALLESMERQHRGEDIEAEITAVLDPLDADPELAGASIAVAVRCLWLAVVNVARLQGRSYGQATAEFRTFVEAGFGIEDENTARLRHLEALRDPSNVRPSMWPTESKE